MSVTETLAALGSWEIQLRDETPDYILDQLGFFGHVAIADGYVDVAGVGAGLLTGSRYVGVLRAKDKDTGRTLSGSGMVFWLGDEDEKGRVQSELDLSGKTLVQAVTAILAICPSVHAGTINSAVGVLGAGKKYQIMNPRQILSAVCDAFNVEFRVNGNGTLDVGTAAQLYNTEAPDTIVVRKGAGTDMDLVALGGKYEVGENAYDYSTGVWVIGRKIGTGDTPEEIFVMATSDAPSVPYFDLFGNEIEIIRVISASAEDEASAQVTADLNRNRFARVAVSLKVTAEEYETEGNFVVGDNVYVYDPDTGIVNAANEVTFRGEVLHPDVVRASGVTWPVVRGMTVAFRTQAGVWLDLTPFVTWETGGNELTVGDLPKSLTKPGDNPVQVRLDAVRADASIPNAPTSLALTTFSTLNAQGVTGAVIHAAWTAPSLNTDGSVITDLSHYVVQYRWTARAPQWQEAPVTADTERDIIVTPGLPYEVRVAAVDLGGKLSAWTSTVTITSAADAIAPNPPADPVVTSYLGQLRIEYAGTDSTGNPMATDTNRIDVHVGTTVGFTASLATRVSSITPFAKGVAYATAPYGSTRYVRLIAVDHSGNASASSAVVSGATTQVADGDVASMSVGKLTAGTMSADVIVSGRFTTALTGQRREVNAVGFQAFNASNVLTVSIDGVNNLLTGIFKTALTGRRIEIGSGASLGDINFYAPDGTNAVVRAFTNGVEAMQMSVPKAGAASTWNGFQVQSDENIYMVGRHLQFFYGGGSGTQSVTFTHTANKLLNTNVTRFSMDPDSSSFWVPNSGNFYIFDVGELQARFWIDGDGGNGIYHSHGQQFRIGEWVPGNIAVDRFIVSDSQVNFNWPGTSARTEIIMSGFSDRSTTLVMTKSDNYGTRLYHKSVPGTGASHRLEFRDAGDSIYEDLWAAAFTVASSRRWKSDIRDAPDPSAILRRIRPVVFKRQLPQPDGDDGPVAYEDDDTLGVVAEELPDELRVDGPDGSLWNVGPTVVAAVAMLQRLDARLDKLEGK